MLDSSLHETSRVQERERTWWILFAVLPTVAFLLSVGFYALAVRPTYTEIFKDFGAELPKLTQFMLHASPVLVVGPPILLSLGLLWSVWKQSTTKTLCLSVGCLSLGFSGAVFLHISLVAPLASLVLNLT